MNALHFVIKLLYETWLLWMDGTPSSLIVKDVKTPKDSSSMSEPLKCYYTATTKLFTFGNLNISFTLDPSTKICGGFYYMKLTN